MEKSIHSYIPLTALSEEIQEYLHCFFVFSTVCSGISACYHLLRFLWNTHIYLQVAICYIAACAVVFLPCRFLYYHFCTWSDAQVRRVLNDGDVPNFMGMTKRYEALDDIRGNLRFLVDDPQPTRILVLHGMGGSGKTVLAAEAVHCPVILKQCFHDGVVWKSVGHMRGMYGETLRSELNKLLSFILHHPLVNPRHHNKGVSDLPGEMSSIKHHLRRQLREKKMLLILDDVWHPDIIDVFTNLPIVLLVTTRMRTIAEQVAAISTIRYVQVTNCNEHEARNVITSICGHIDGDVMNAILKRCNGLPLALAIMASVLKDKSASRQMVIVSTPRKAEWLREKFPSVLRRYAGLADALIVSISELEREIEEKPMGKLIMPSGPDIANLYMDIAAVDEDDELFASKFVPVWKHEDPQFTRRLLETFADRNLLIRTGKKRGEEDVFIIPDVLLDFLRELVIWREGSMNDRYKRWIGGFLLKNNHSYALALWEHSKELFGMEELWCIIRTFEHAFEELPKEWWQQCMQSIAVLLEQRDKFPKFQNELFVMLMSRISPGEMGWTIVHQAALEGLSTAILPLRQDFPHLTIHMATNGTTRANSGYVFSNGTVPLHAASASGKTSVVTLLIQNGADANPKDTDGRIPLHLACENGHDATAEVLIKYGANIEAKTNTTRDNLHAGSTPLHIASSQGHTDVAKVLIEAGANVNEKGIIQITPLHKAIHFGHTETAKVLIKAGANVNEDQRDGQTPLHLASYMGITELVKVLLDSKANKNIKDNKQKISKDVICACGCAEESQCDAIRRLLDE